MRWQHQLTIRYCTNFRQDRRDEMFSVSVVLQEYNAESSAFQKHYHDFSQAIQDAPGLSLRLYSAGLLTSDARKNICSTENPTQQVIKLLDAMEGQIKVDPPIFYKFVEELEKDDPMKPLCSKLRDTLG